MNSGTRPLTSVGVIQLRAWAESVFISDGADSTCQKKREIAAAAAAAAAAINRMKQINVFLQ